MIARESNQDSEVSPGKLTQMCAPVSVCQYVSTTEHLPLPTFSSYHFHASGLMGSPTDPRTLSDERS